MGAWQITAVTPDVVLGRDVQTGRSVTWDRDRIERGLATGELGTTLGQFERTKVHRIPGADGDAVRVIAFGDDGHRYVREYSLDHDGSSLHLRRENARSRGINEDMGRLLDRLATVALAEVGPGDLGSEAVEEPAPDWKLDVERTRGR